MKAAVTVSLVPEARGGPFVFHDGLADGCRRAAALGFDAIEIFPRSVATIDRAELRSLLAEHNLSVAAFGTGAGWVVEKLTLTSPAANIRSQAVAFIRSILELAAEFGAPAIIGSMQGRLEPNQDREEALEWLRASLNELGEIAAARNTFVLLEPLNRYETNVFNRLEETLLFLQTLRLTTNGKESHVKLLADLFHMNIEEANIAAALRGVAPHVGHIHFADSNRRAIGLGHTEMSTIVSAIREIGYQGYLSAEIFPLPDAETAARQTIESVRRLFP